MKDKKKAKATCSTQGGQTVTTKCRNGVSAVLDIINAADRDDTVKIRKLMKKESTISSALEDADIRMAQIQISGGSARSKVKDTRNKGILIYGESSYITEVTDFVISNAINGSDTVKIYKLMKKGPPVSSISEGTPIKMAQIWISSSSAIFKAKDIEDGGILIYGKSSYITEVTDFATLCARIFGLDVSTSARR